MQQHKVTLENLVWDDDIVAPAAVEVTVFAEDDDSALYAAIRKVQSLYCGTLLNFHMRQARIAA